MFYLFPLSIYFEYFIILIRMIFIKNLYASFLFYFYSNHKIEFSNNTGSISASYNTYYIGNPNDCNCIIKIDDTLISKNNVVELQNTNPKSSKIKSVVFVIDTFISNPSPSTLYIFKKTDDILYSQRNIFFDPRILKVALETQVFMFMLKNLKFQNMTIRIKNTNTVTVTFLTYSLCIAFLCFVFVFSRSFIKKLSKLDPIFSDFSIMSSDIKKYKELEERKMTECTICFEEFIPEDDIRILDCKHYYHPRCIDRWLIGHSKRCPCCRVDIVINERV